MSDYKGKVMSESELDDFVERVGRSELFQEYYSYEAAKRVSPKIFNSSGPQFFYKGVCSTLVTLGYDYLWVFEVVSDRLRARYDAVARDEAKQKVLQDFGK